MRVIPPRTFLDAVTHDNGIIRAFKEFILFDIKLNDKKIMALNKKSLKILNNQSEI